MRNAFQSNRLRAANIEVLTQSVVSSVYSDDIAVSVYSDGACRPVGHNKVYYPHTLSLSQVTATQTKGQVPVDFIWRYTLLTDVNPVQLDTVQTASMRDQVWLYIE